MAAGSEEPNALVQVESPFPEPMLTATTVELFENTLLSTIGPRGCYDEAKRFAEAMVDVLNVSTGNSTGTPRSIIVPAC